MVKRLTTPEEVKEVFNVTFAPNLVEKYHTFHDIGEEIAPEILLKNFSYQLKNNPAFRFFGGYSGDKPEGFICGFILPDMLNDVLFGSEYLWIMSGQHKSEKQTSKELAQAFIDECKKEGCRRVVFGLSAYQQPEVMREMYRRNGYAAKGEIFSKLI